MKAGSEEQRKVLLIKDRRKLKELKKKYKRLEEDQKKHRYAVGRWAQVSYEEEWAWETFQHNEQPNPQTRMYMRWSLQNGNFSLELHHGELKAVVDTYHNSYYAEDGVRDHLPACNLTSFVIEDSDEFFADMPWLVKQRQEYKRLIKLDWPLRKEMMKVETRIGENKKPIK